MRTLVLCAFVVLAAAPASATVDYFHCGKSFITFPVQAPEDSKKMIWFETVRKSEVQRLYNNTRQPKIVLAGSSALITITMDTYLRIIACLD